ncbi:archaellin/type IV pilin N-terminal domain-containing protein [Nitrosopumilus piranensis]|uniref:Archaeal Type IV pilin N-terminal domain-containing protein n=1 Tax=Nitrosopumilus piranensis TaxID=1582439 RepID=A0A0C5C1H3_9ARCH|nr:archaellin/type IV pilin N-terminal domain-containing protein [Nitrosopumilus piranensis]AJM93210.1 conserved exported protein of unknown function [Nitrosopumilus piranensis]
MNHTTSRRAVAPVIATILLVAIAVVGGTLVFTFSSGVFNEQQLNTPAAIESLIITGYDARDTAARLAHNGTSVSGVTGVATPGAGLLAANDEVWIFVQNAGTNPIDIVTVTFAGTTYPFSATAASSTYNIADNSGLTSDQVLEAGEEATIIVDLANPIKIGRSGLVQISTGSGEFSEKIQIGRQLG